MYHIIMVCYSTPAGNFLKLLCVRVS